MTTQDAGAKAMTSATRKHPALRKTKDGTLEAQLPEGAAVEDLLGMKTSVAAMGVYSSALAALGCVAETSGDMASAMFAEIEPRDAIEAMLVAQMSATHIAMSHLSARAIHKSTWQVQESHVRSMSRLSKTFLAQVDALKRYRSKAQQVVRVERVTVNEGGQAIVGDVAALGGA